MGLELVADGRMIGTNRMKWIVAITSSLALNLALIFLGRGDLMVSYFGIWVSVRIGIPLLVASFIIIGIGVKRKSQRSRNTGAWCLTIAFAILSTLSAIPIGNRVLKSDMARAKAYCESLVPSIEERKNQTGLYPRRLSDLPGGRGASWFLPRCDYHSDGTNYHFSIINRGDMMGGVDYNNTSRTWFYWN